MLARACGKTNVHSLQPEEPAALTIEASAMARFLSRPRPTRSARPSTRSSRGEAAASRSRRRRSSRFRRGRRTPGGAEMSRDELAYSEPEKTRPLDAEFLAVHRFPYQEYISSSRTSTSTATPGDDPNWLEDVEPLHEDGAPAASSLQQCLPEDRLPDPPRPRARTRAQGARHVPPDRKPERIQLK